jgi:hypothetical protein
MRHDASHLAFCLCRLDHPAVEEHRAAGQRERVDLFLIHDPERVRELGMTELGWNRSREPRSNVGDILIDPRVVEQR